MKVNFHILIFIRCSASKRNEMTLVIFGTNAVLPLPDFLKIGSSAEIREVGIEIIIQK